MSNDLLNRLQTAVIKKMGWEEIDLVSLVQTLHDEGLGIVDTRKINDELAEIGDNIVRIAREQGIHLELGCDEQQPDGDILDAVRSDYEIEELSDHLTSMNRIELMNYASTHSDSFGAAFWPLKERAREEQEDN